MDLMLPQTIVQFLEILSTIVKENLPLIILFVGLCLIIKWLGVFKLEQKEKYEWIKNNTFWIALSVGFFLMTVHYTFMLMVHFFTIDITNGSFVFKLLLSDFSKTLGNIFLSGGIFAAKLKSLQFTNIFKEEIQKVMEDEETLQNRVDLSQFWGKVTRALYKSKYPEISAKIESYIASKYLPKENELSFYYANAHDVIDISIDNNGFITLTK